MAGDSGTKAAGGNMAKPGEDLQLLVRAIEKATHHATNVTVHSPMRLRDKYTGRMREHDVVLIFKQSHHSIVLALECRDRSRKIGVPDVEGFHAKCVRTGVDRGVMVSSLGFAKTALTKARSYGIDCLTLDQATGFDWCTAPGVHVRMRRLLNTNVNAICDRAVQAGATLYSNNPAHTEPVNPVDLGLNCLRQIPGVGDDEPEGRTIRRQFIDENPSFHVVDTDGEKLPVRKLVVSCDYVIDVTLVPFEFHTYTDASAGTNLYTVATAPLRFGPFTGRMMVVQSKDGARITWVPDAQGDEPEQQKKQIQKQDR